MLLMPDHLHGIIGFPREPGMAHIVATWKHFQSRCCGIRWQRDFFDHRLRNAKQLEDKWNYILENPQRAGLCANPANWPFVRTIG